MLSSCTVRALFGFAIEVTPNSRQLDSLKNTHLDNQINLYTRFRQKRESARW